MNPVALGTVAEVIAGQSPDGRFYNAIGDGLPFYQGKKDFGEKFIKPATVWTTQTTKTAKAGDILMSVRAPVGPINFATEAVCIGRGLAAIRSTDKIDLDYLFYQLLYLQPEISGSEGAVFASINKAQIEALPVIVPAMAEQQRIVAILDEAFAGIATAKANAQKSLRSTVAISERYVEVACGRTGTGWSSATLGELVSFRNGINFTRSSRGERLRILGVKDFQANFWAPDEGLDYVTVDGLFSDDECLRKDDLVFVRSNGNPALIGRCVLVGAMSERTTHSGFTIRARLTVNTVLPAYLCHVLKSGVLRKEMVDGGNGANIKSLSQGTLSRLKIAFPNIDDQRRIVDELGQVQVEARRLETIYCRKLAALDEFKQSLLHRAFSGRL